MVPDGNKNSRGGFHLGKIPKITCHLGEIYNEYENLKFKVKL